MISAFDIILHHCLLSSLPFVSSFFTFYLLINVFIFFDRLNSILKAEGVKTDTNVLF